MRLALGEAELHHLRRVLRLRPGRALEVLDGSGRSYRAVLLGWSAPQVEVLAAEDGAGPVLPAPPAITVLLGALKGPRMDWAVEKLSELGVERIVPLVASRSVAPPRVERLRRIARESARQCGRARLLEVTEPIVPGEAELPDGLTILLDRGGPALREVFSESNRVCLAIGPEGGFSAEETRGFEGRGARPARLGGLVLRSETAAAAAVVAVLALSGR